MSQSFFEKVKKILTKDMSKTFSAKEVQSLIKVTNTDVSDIVGDVKANKILADIQKNNNRTDLLTQLADLYISYNKPEKAVDIYIGLAHRVLESKNPSQSITYINLGLKILPDHGPLNMFSADLDIRLGRFSDAPEKYRKAAAYYIKKNDKMTAIFLLRRIRDMNQATQKDLLNLAGTMISENMCDDAFAILMPLKEKLAAEGEKSVKEREACLMMLHSIRKDNIAILVELVETRIEMEQYDRALILIKKLTMRDPRNVNLLKREAFVHKKMGDIQTYGKILKIIANIYSDEGNIVYRNIYFHKILKYFPDDVEALSVLKLEDQIREKVDSKIENTDSKIKMFDV
ncbi:MAG TPA: hypothetical protein PLZ43_03890 [bacterium]|nr:hypothetical protein [bacterium]